MGPLPKRKISRSRRNNRRSHDALTLNHLVVCGTCGEYHVAHRVCAKCGSYNDVSVINMSDDKA